ncbi:hypothetical protein GWL_19630 [Herbaspirillum sp. GW103]|jgi:hypothetical protein|nr:hypothetical protein GWL_19630 [Herbaspirillum sp. GW103]
MPPESLRRFISSSGNAVPMQRCQLFRDRPPQAASKIPAQRVNAGAHEGFFAALQQ